MSNWTDDALVFPDLILRQPAAGYRFNLDSVLLARLPAAPRRGRVIDLGCGVGAVALLLARSHPQLEICGLDREGELIAAARENARGNGLAERCRFLCGDFAHVHGLEPGSFAAAYLNPPYYAPGRGRAAQGPLRRGARQQTEETRAAALGCARRLVKSGGYLHLILRSDTLVGWLAAIEGHGFSAKRMRMIHGRADLPAKVALLSARKGAREGMVVEPPLLIYTRPGLYTREAQRLVRG